MKPEKVLRALLGLLIVLTLLVSTSLFVVSADPDDFAGGTGEVEDPYQIADWHHLDNVRYYMDACFILVNDLDSGSGGYGDLAGATANGGDGWQPIGASGDGFSGIFDGQGYEVTGMRVNRSGEDYVGLFGLAGDGATVTSVNVADAQVSGALHVGALVGYLSGEVSGCSSTGTSTQVTGTEHVGGLVGVNAGNVEQCYSAGAVTGEKWVGGLVAWNAGTLSRSWASGDVVGNHCVGGLVGTNDGGMISDCFATGDATELVEWYVGGLVGYNNGTVSDCYSTGVPTGTDRVGGLIGYNNDTVADCYWDEDTSGTTLSSGGTAKSTAEMLDIDTFSGWDIADVAHGDIDSESAWNIVDGRGYPFLSLYRVQFQLSAGWNMVSVPRGLPDGMVPVADVFKGRIEDIYLWDPLTKTYVVPSSVEPYQGYWVAVDEDMTISYLA